MTSVLPPWKLELIEKKKKRLEEEKAKEKEKEDRYSSLPEWKRSILVKRKGAQGVGEDLTTNNEDKPNQSVNAGSIQNDRPFSQGPLKKFQRSREEDGRELLVETTSSKTSESLQNGNQVGEHSFVANSLLLSDKQEEHVDKAVGLSNSTNKKAKEEEESRVSYEHIKTPSELRRLYEIQVARKKANSAAQESKELSSIRKRSNSGSLGDGNVPSPKTQIHETPSQKIESTDSKTNGILAEDENDTDILQTQRKVRFSEEESVEAPALNKINQQDTSVGDVHEDESKKELQNGEEISSEVHVNTIRDKFGPSGFFRLRSASIDNLLKSSPEQTPSSSPKARPSPPNKRWSMVSLSRASSSDDESVTQSKLPHGGLQRARSMTDMLGDHPHEPIHLRHRASVSYDIEHRIHELLHHLSASDDNTDDEYIKDDNLFNDIKTRQSPTGKEADEKPHKERRASWSVSESIDNESIPTSPHINHIDEKPLPSSNKALSDQKSHEKFNEESKESILKSEHSAKQEEIKIKKHVTELQHAELSVDQRTLKSDSANEASTEVEDGLQSSRPSVHKLSALFGSSIKKGSKKIKDDKKSDNKSVTIKQENKAESKESNSKDTSKSKKFPWSKKGTDSKKDTTINQSTEETKFPFEGSQGLKPIHKRYVEHKITGNMTLVLGANTDNSYSKTHDNLKAPALYQKSSFTTTKQSKIIPESPQKKPTTNVDYDNEHITIIDVPDPSPRDIEISAIDMPESPTPVSVIDMPVTQDGGVKVSVIDLPGDSDSDDSDSGISGSYEINPGAGANVYTFESDNSESADGEEDDDDDDDIEDNPPVSYVVVFETERENVKSCLRRSLHNRKRKGKVIFHSEKLVKIHDYPSEQCLQSHFDEMEREKQGGLAKYQPSALKNVNVSLEYLKSRESAQAKDENSNDKYDELNNDDTKITYSDEGEGFSSSSSSSGAMLF